MLQRDAKRCKELDYTVIFTHYTVTHHVLYISKN